MRIHRISLRDFRGVEPIDATFDPAGITIVEGRNEIGKTSIADAFMLLLDEKDTANSKRVRAVQPIGRDVGPFVEAELTVGPYHVVYRKQWRRGRRTELEVIAPSVEQLTGEDAHNRMLEILEGETDPALFRALRYQQGVAISQAEVAQAPSLIAALDAAAGGTGSPTGRSEDALMDRVEQERLRYFTPGGAVTKARTEMVARLEALHGEAGATEERIRRLEETADRQRQIEGELAQLAAQGPVLAEQVDQHRQIVQAIEQIERRVEAARHAHAQAEATLREATAARDRRQELVNNDATASKGLADLEAEIASAEPGLAAAHEAVAQAEKARDKAVAALEAAEREAAKRNKLVELLELRLARDQFRERQQRVAEADATIEAAERFLTACKLDDALIAEIDQAAERLALARGRLEAGMPRLSVEALKPVELTVNGEVRTATPGATIEELVSEHAEVLVGDVARVAVSREAATDDAQGALSEAERLLSELFNRGAVSSQAEARELARERARQESERDSASQRREDALRDLEPAQLAAKLGRAEERLADLEGDHDVSAAGAESFDDARGLAAETATAVRDARSRHEDRQTDLSAAQGALRVLEDRAIEHRTRRQSAREAAENATSALEADRKAAPDADLDTAVNDAERELAGMAETRTAAEQQLTAGDPDSARAKLENAEKLQQGQRDRAHKLEIESAEKKSHLELEGHEGLADRLADTRAKLEELQREVDSESRRADAARRLHECLTARREQAQRAYVGPFANKVNAYARILYGSGVEVTIDHQKLEVLSRTLDGTTVPFELLSGGAREQLAVITRLACAALVSPPPSDGSPGGVPVIIDDALGYSDPERLKRIGAALAVAGRDCQVIVLTCEPGRYRGVGGAKVVALGQSR